MVWFDAFQVSNLLTFLPESAYQSAVDYFEGIPTGKFLFFILVMCLKGSSIGALSALPYAMAADVVDVDASMTGKRQGGAYFSIWSMVRKMTYALGVTTATTLVVWAGFDSLADPENTTNTPFSLLVLTCVYSIIPALFKLATVPILWNYELTEDRLASVQAQAEARLAAG